MADFESAHAHFYQPHLFFFFFLMTGLEMLRLPQFWNFSFSSRGSSMYLCNVITAISAWFPKGEAKAQW